MSASSSTQVGDHVSEPIINEEESRYRYASNVNISNFISASPLTKSNYTLWKKQMLCLLDSLKLRGFVDARTNFPPEIRSPDIITQYKSLVKGWIYRSLDEDMHGKVDNDNVDARGLWERLERLYNSEEDPQDHDDIALKQRVIDLTPEQVEVTINTETETLPILERLEVTVIICNKKLVKAVVDGRWFEAKRILKKNIDFARAALTYHHNGFTVLHIAVIEGRNDFLERLLDFIIDGENIIIVKSDCDGNKTALHYAALFNNKRAAQLLVKKCERLLFVKDDVQNCIPLETAYMKENLDTFLYLWEAVSDKQPNHEAINRIRNRIDFNIVKDAISTKQYGLASRLVNTFPRVAMKDVKLLMAMARTFPSDLGFRESLICPSVNNFHQRIAKRSSLLLNAPGVLYAWADDVLWATRSLKEAMWLLQQTVLILLVLPVAVLYPLYQLIRLLILVILYPLFMVYFLLLKVLAIADIGYVWQKELELEAGAGTRSWGWS